jgi:cytochrome P450
LKDFGFGKRSIEESIHFEVAELVEGFLSSKGDILIGTDFNVPIINILWQMVADSRFTPEDSAGMKMVDMVTTIFTVGIKIDQLPLFINKMFPTWTGYGTRSRAHISILDYLMEVVKQHEADLDQSNPKDFIDVYLTEIIKQDSKEDYNVQELVACIYDFFVAGTETSSTTLKWVVLYLTLYQDVQER